MQASTPTTVAILACVAACHGEDFRTAELEVGAATSVNGCQVFLFANHSNMLSLQHVCRGEPGEPGPTGWPGVGGYTLSLGDCVPLGRRYYCATSIDPPQLEATFEASAGGQLSHLHRIRD